MSGLTEASLVLKHGGKLVKAIGGTIGKHRHKDNEAAGYWGGSDDGQRHTKNSSKKDDGQAMLVEIGTLRADAPTIKVKYADDEVELDSKDLEVRKPSKKEKFFNVLGKMIDTAIFVATIVGVVVGLEVITVSALAIAAIIGTGVLIAGLTKAVKEKHAYKKELKAYLQTLTPEELQQYKNAKKIGKRGRIKNKLLHRIDKTNKGNDEVIKDLLNDPSFQKSLNRQTSQININSGGQKIEVKSLDRKTASMDDLVENEKGQIEIDMDEFLALLNSDSDATPGKTKDRRDSFSSTGKEIGSLAAAGDLSLTDLMAVLHQPAAAAR